MSQSSRRVPVSPAAAGSRAQATPRRPGGRSAPAPQQHAEQQADHGEREAEGLPGRGVDAVHPTSLRRATGRDDGAMRAIPDPGFAGDDGEAPARGDGGAARPTTPTPTPATTRPWRCCSTPACWCRSSRCSARSSTTSGAGARQDLRHGDGADDRTRRPHGAAGVHEHRGAAPVGPRGAAGAGPGEQGGGGRRAGRRGSDAGRRRRAGAVRGGDRRPARARAGAHARRGSATASGG